jgi:hypothetical protein
MLRCDIYICSLYSHMPILNSACRVGMHCTNRLSTESLSRDALTPLRHAFNQTSSFQVKFCHIAFAENSLDLDKSNEQLLTAKLAVLAKSAIQFRINMIIRSFRHSLFFRIRHRLCLEFISSSISVPSDQPGHSTIGMISSLTFQFV